MTIGVLSDTHLRTPEEAQSLADKLLRGPFAAVDAILHAGDIVIPGLEDCFVSLPFYAVRGNMDFALQELPISRIVAFAGTKIGLIHGWGAAANIESRVLSHFANDSVDAIVFGHSHKPLCRKADSVLLFNPGSATDRREAECHTVGLLTIDNGIYGEIIPID